MNTTRIQLDLTPKQIEQLREVIDRLPLNRYAPLIVAVLPKLPLDSAATVEPLSAGDGSPAVRGPGFFITARTDRGREMLPLLEQALGEIA